MLSFKNRFSLLAMVSIFLFSGQAIGGEGVEKFFPLSNADGLILKEVTAQGVTYLGKMGLEVSGQVVREDAQPNQPVMAMISDLDFHDGVIEVDLSGSVKADAPAAARGFVGLAFRVMPDFSSYECFYIRPTNGRANDQVRRNHSTQYHSFPGYDFARFREEAPEKYEAYADMLPDVWQHIKIEVSGETAKLFVNHAEQPCLIVNDLKRGATQRGSIGLWVEPTTLAHFANLKVTLWD